MLKINNKVITKETKICASVASKALGLMFSRRIKDKALVFVNAQEEFVPLHMLFVFQTIDILFLDSNKRIVELKRDFKPFTMYIPTKKAKFVIELPQDTVRKKKIKAGDMCKFRY